MIRPSLNLGHISGQWALGSLADFEFDLLALTESPEALSLDLGKVDENVLTGLLLDETISLGFVEPLYFASQNRPP